jgi:hypothetical protein
MIIKRNLIFRWVAALILAVVIGKYLGRAIAWYRVYSQPSEPVMMEIPPEDRNQEGEGDREQRGRQPKSLSI